jgi:hypothetical protein
MDTYFRQSRSKSASLEDWHKDTPSNPKEGVHTNHKYINLYFRMYRGAGCLKVWDHDLRDSYLYRLVLAGKL